MRPELKSPHTAATVAGSAIFSSNNRGQHSRDHHTHSTEHDDGD